jgi:hypothetical protein
MQAMEKIMCKKIACSAFAASLGGWRMLFEHGRVEDVPDHIIARSKTLGNSASAASEDADGSFILTFPRGIVLSWLDCQSNLSLNGGRLQECGVKRLLAYLQVPPQDRRAALYIFS